MLAKADNNIGWRRVRLRDISTLITKGTTPTTIGYSFSDRGINFIKAESVTPDGGFDKEKFSFIDHETNKALKRSVLQEGDILFSMAGMVIGKTAVVPKEVLPANTNQALGIIRLDQTKADPRFIHYFIRNKTFNQLINSLVAQSAQPNLNLTDIGNLMLTIPPVEIQRRIAEILGALDDKIECNRKMNKTLERMAQALYKHWFVDFGPFKDGEFVDSELGTIPKGWKLGILGELVTIDARVLNPQDFSDEEFLHYSIPAYDEGRTPKREFGQTILSGKYIVDSNRVLVSKLNPRFYRVWTVYRKDGVRSISSTEFIGYLQKEFVTWSFLNCHVRSDTFIKEFCSHVSGTTGSRQRVNPERTLAFKCLIPATEVLWQFDEIVGAYLQQIENNIEENQNLVSTRDYLLPKLLSGEIEVKAIEKDLEEVV